MTDKLLVSINTYFMAVNIIDQYLTKSIVIKAELLNVGVTSLFIASKFEVTLNY